MWSVWIIRQTLSSLRRLQGTSNCGGLISGNLVVTHKGNLDVHAHDMGLTMRLTFKEPGMFSGKRGSKHEVHPSEQTPGAGC